MIAAFKKPAGAELGDIQKMFNKAHNRLRAIAERGNSLLETTFKALRNVSVCPWKIGQISAAALVILHIEHGRTIWSPSVTRRYPEWLSAVRNRQE